MKILKKIARNFLKIEYVLLYLSIFSIFSTIIFKAKEVSTFKSLLANIEFCKNNAESFLGWEKSKRTDYLASINEDFKPFSFYNDRVDESLKNFIAMFYEEKNLSATLLDDQYFQLYKLLYEQQRQLNFGYEWLVLISFFMVVVAFFSIMEKENSRKNELRILEIVSENQIKMSRDIHDGIAQDLAALKISIQNQDKEKTSYFADLAFNEVRFLIENSHVKLTEELVTHINDVLTMFEHNFGIKTEFYVASNNINLLPVKYQFEFLRILHEALSNIARHSEANNVIVRITDVMNGLNFIIKDDGIGDSSFMNEKKDLKNHYGIENIRSRVLEMNGTVNFDFSGGTTIAITLENFISR